jgi:hypothetical protein
MIVAKAMKNEPTSMQFFFAFIIRFAMMFVEGESFLLLGLPSRKTFDLPPANHFSAGKRSYQIVYLYGCK